MGCYIFTNNITGDQYVGSSINISKRIIQHSTINPLSINYFDRVKLKYNLINFSLAIIKVDHFIDRTRCLEQYFLDTYICKYNVSKKLNDFVYKINDTNCIYVYKISDSSKILDVFINIKEASENLNIPFTTIFNALKGKYTTRSKYHFTYKALTNNQLKNLSNNNLYYYLHDLLEEEEMTQFSSIAEAGRSINVNRGTAIKAFNNNLLILNRYWISKENNISNAPIITKIIYIYDTICNEYIEGSPFKSYRTGFLVIESLTHTVKRNRIDMPIYLDSPKLFLDRFRLTSYKI
uniref:Orf292 n=1 Tax=Rhizophydium sp. 136 TaxID=60187 RepID=Q950M2_9FUNG|nr:orf292 [Rhizophydium sp. 136]AAK84286.1 orf292 [Rhizophydium sp. 136]